MLSAAFVPTISSVPFTTVADRSRRGSSASDRATRFDRAGDIVDLRSLTRCEYWVSGKGPPSGRKNNPVHSRYREARTIRGKLQFFAGEGSPTRLIRFRPGVMDPTARGGRCSTGGIWAPRPVSNL